MTTILVILIFAIFIGFLIRKYRLDGAFKKRASIDYVKDAFRNREIELYSCEKRGIKPEKLK